MRDLGLVTLCCAILCCSIATGWAATIVDTGPPDGQLAIESGSRVGLAGSQFTGAAGFRLDSGTVITGGSFTGFQGSTLAALFDFSSVQVSIYSVTNPQSPSTVPGALLDTRSSLNGELAFTPPFPPASRTITVPTSIGLTGVPGGALIGPLETVPFQLLDPIVLPAGDYFFSAQVATTCDNPGCAAFPPSPSQGYFFWLSTPFPQGNSDVAAAFMGNATAPPPFWVSTFSVGGAHSLSFSLNGQAVPEPGTARILFPVLLVLAYIAHQASRQA